MIQSTVFRFAGAAAVAALLFAGCGGPKTATTTQKITSGARQSTQMVAPADMNCGVVKPVWVNLKSKAYHKLGDPYYGKGKDGKYMCPSAAVTAGYHAAGGMRSHRRGRHHHMMKNGAMMNASPAPDEGATNSP